MKEIIKEIYRRELEEMSNNELLFEFEFCCSEIEVINAKRQLNSVYGKFATNPYTISTAQKVGIHRVAYIDTDSIHLVGTQVPDAIKDIIDDKELGYWGLESVFTRSYFIGAKSYVEEIEISYKEYVEHQQEYISENDCKDNLYYIREGVCYYLNVKMVRKRICKEIILNRMGGNK